MTVKNIVSRKGRDVVTMEPSATLEAAIATLAEHRIGALVVLGADRRVIGILSERDIVREFAELGADALTKRLAQAMTREMFGRLLCTAAISHCYGVDVDIADQLIERDNVDAGGNDFTEGILSTISRSDH